ncbi:non-ribosomal peptide synthetase [Chamaesiphon polymorphus]|uniref:Non-ribosomal peptide synthetase n=1 Tax=Chamaesiphon polymorphus CCALA 037 TaxID=2107692 RepID=A0A2T1GNM7_9CYAN|nr:non-ribosomal peptide synthetase [Chamaesiphon polymorphus]PSB59548.1 non-ribosomal peptide synthetase [Chamaesiphon polymorphus CCALA 037]
MNTVDRANPTNPNKNVAAIYPLTPMQQGMLFHTLYTAGSTLYFEQLCCTLQGELDEAKFAAAWQQVADRHAVLRTAFLWEKIDKPLQVVGKVVNLPWTYHDWRSDSTDAQQAQLEAFLTADRLQGFKLNQAPLMRFTSIRVADDRYKFVWSYHHLLIDGWSLPTLIQEVFAYYEAAIQGETLTLDLPRPYRDYVVWREKQDVESANRFWQQYLQGIDTPTPVPIRLKTSAQQPIYQTIDRQLSESTTAQIQEFARRHQLTLNTVFQGVWGLLLARYSGESEALFGATVSGRPPVLTGVETMVGLFINAVPVRIALPAHTRVLEWLQGIQQQQLAAQAYDYSSLVDIQGVSEVPRGLSLFDTLLVFENYPISESLQSQQLSLDVSDIHSFEQTNYPLTLVAIPSGQLTLQANYDASQFEYAAIERLLGHFQQLLLAVVTHPDWEIEQLSLLTEAEVAELQQWQPQPQAPSQLCLHQAFDRQVSLNPERIAVVCGTESLSYAALNHRANRLAHYLQSLGVAAETLVGIYMERSIDLIVSTLAIVKAGGAYVPLDPTTPVARLSLMLDDTQLPILLTQADLLAQLPTTTATTICVDRDWQLWASASDSNPTPAITPASLAYIIYTSGSTGVPKGVMIPHQGITRLVLDTNYVSLNASDRIAQAANTAFDAATFEIWGALLNGAQIVIIPRSVLLDPTELAMLLQEQEITVLFLTTALFNRMASLVPTAFARLRCLLMGGEAIDPVSVRAILATAPPEQLIHVYGPTESTTFTSWYRISDVPATATNIPIGRPVAQTEILILDRQLQQVPVGIPGELHIGGSGLARGYWQRPELTAEKFIPHPWGEPGALLYKTGDLVRYLPSGEIEYLDRIDQQVKIRGFRIELGEIEAVLSQHPGILQVSVQAQAIESGAKQLVAYIVSRSSAELSPSELRQFLATRLPDYMIPAMFMPLSALPLTPNGKVDKRSLPAPDRSQAIGASYVAPRTELEQQLAQIWSEVLGTIQIGIFNSFFDLGGHSLIATQLISRIRRNCQVELSLQTLFNMPTIAELATEIERGRTPSCNTLPLVSIDRDRLLPLSFAQQRLWFLQQLDPQSTAYHIPIALRLQGNLDVNALQQSLQAIVQRHESLRTNFALDSSGQPYQSMRSTVTVPLPTIDVRHLGAAPAAAIAAATSSVNDTIFDLTTDLLLRAQLLQLGADEYLLLFCIHHISADGWSMGIIIRELVALYTAAIEGQAASLPELAIQYADFAHWQRQLLTGDLRQQQLAYWQQQLANLTPLELPTDRPRPAVQTTSGATQEFALSAELSRSLVKLSQQTGTTLFMTLLAAFQILLSRYSGQMDIAVGSPIANRNREEIEHLIGFFVNTLVLRTDLSGSPTFRELANRVRQTTLAAYEHQDLPFEIIVEALQPDRDLSHSPLFQVMFVLQNAPTSELKLPGLNLSAVATPTTIAKFDLTLAIAEPANSDDAASGLTGVWEYNTDLFDLATIDRMSGHFEQLLSAIVNNPDGAICQLQPIAPAEIAQLGLFSQGVEQFVATDRCIHQLIADRAIAQPTAIAVVWGDLQLTYAELDARSNQLAHYLQDVGVRAETVVGICVERSLELIVGLLGILKAGGAYVPIDPSYPAARLAAILADTQMPVLLTQASLVAQLPEHQAQVVCLDRDWATIATNTSNPCPNLVTAARLAYIVYTSGSTGTPKGVMIPHRGLLNLVAWHHTAFAVTAADRATQLAGIAFDAAGWEIWPYLAAGATLLLVPPTAIHHPTELRDWLLDRQITISFVPTPVAEQLFHLDWPDTTALRMMLVGGDRLATNPATRMPFQVVNNYGPTENTVVTTSVVLDDSNPDAVPTIGRPIANTQVYCLDDRGQLAPIGIPGELWIGGASLARGYLNRPELTAEKFVAHPQVDGAILYRSGDRGRYLADGQIEYLGRLDEQVKIRGFRIELGEIETVLNQHPELFQAVVVAIDRDGQQKLVAYTVPMPDAQTTSEQLRQFLGERLPDYMIPAYFVTLDELPLTPNGKVDKRALPLPDLTAEMGKNYVAPRTSIEAQLAAIWAQVLGTPQVGIHDNFFAIGGDSILSLQIIARAAQAGIQLTPKQLFAHQSIAELAAVARTGQAISAEQGVVVGDVPLTPIQRWYFDRDLPAPHHFNQTVLLQIPATVSADLLQPILTSIWQHHDALRLQFQSIDGGWHQTNAALTAVPQLQVVDLGQLTGTEQTDRLTEICDRSQASLDLASGCLLQATLFEMGEGQPQRLLLVVHHLAVDGVSWRILLDDIQTAYQQVSQGQNISLPAKTTSWRQWAQQLVTASGDFIPELDYWHRQIASVSPTLPTDRQGENTASSAETVTVSLDATATQDLLQRVPAAYRTQINDVLIAALAQTMSEWTGESQIQIDLEGHGREELFDDVDISRTVGWFTTMFPICLDLAPDRHPGSLLKSIKKQLRQVPHKGIGYGLLRYVRREPSLSSHVAAPISFNYLGQFDGVLAAESDFEVATESAGSDISLQGERRHLLDINGAIVAGELQLNWTYSSNIYDRQTIERLAQNLIDNLAASIAHCLEPTAGGYTPSDFALARLSQTDLDRLVGDNWRQIADIYPLSPLQQGLLFHSLYAPESGVYMVQVHCMLKGNLNCEIFGKAWQQAIDRYEILRTGFIHAELATPLQCVFDRVPLILHQHDWQAKDLVTQQVDLDRLLERERQQDFDLARPPLMRLQVIQLAADTYKFVWTHHHLLLDGWSLPLVFKEVFAAYHAYERGQLQPLAPATPYRNYIAWLQTQDSTAARSFWQAQLRDITDPTPLLAPTDRSQLDSGYQVARSRLPLAVTTTIQQFARQHQLTMSNLIQGAWALLLSHYSGNADVVFGVTVSGRPATLPGVEEIVGPFINTLPVRVAIPFDAPILPWLQALQHQQQEIDRYAYTPLNDIQGWSEVARGVPLFESIVVFENYPVGEAVSEPHANDLQIIEVQSWEQTNYPLTLIASPGAELALDISFDRSRFTPDSIDRMLEHLQALLAGMVVDGDRSIESIPLLSTPERQQLLEVWHQTHADYPQDRCIHQLFEQQVERTPEAIAIVFEDRCLTYQDLDRCANRLAHYLQSQGVGAETLVGICVERSEAMAIAILAILKAGGAYVPIDPLYPRDRIAYVLADSGLRLLLSQTSLAENWLDLGVTVVCVDGDADRWQQLPVTNLISSATATNLAYIIYTSGSTGQPKGVEIQHRSVINLLWAIIRQLELSATDTLLAVATFSFDISVAELFLPLLVGAKLAIVSRDVAADGYQLLQAIDRYQPTFMQPTPTTWRMLLAAGWQGSPNLKMVSTGEALPADLMQQLLPLGKELWNLYGPTETTIWSTGYRITSPRAPITIGYPIANTQIYILNARRQLVPIGVPGELYIGGAGLARGYWQRSELTADKFIDSPFSTAGERLYRTGDLARYLLTGEVEYLGRIDQQVKIRGYRIELGEIEAVLSQHPDISQTVVVAHSPESRSPQLIAYVVPSANAQPTAEELREFLVERLPAYTIPSMFVTLAELPLTPNGKIDKRALPHPDRGELTNNAYAAPRTTLESQLTAIWAEVLGLSQVGIHDNFFAIGGDSILSLQIVARAGRSGIQLTPKQLFARPSIAELAQVASTGQAIAAEQGIVTGSVPLTPIQHWFFAQNLPEPQHFNQSVLLEVPTDLSADLLQQVLTAIWQHHDALRLQFVATGGSWQQTNADWSAPPQLQTIDLADLSGQQQVDRLTEICSQAQASLDLAAGCLLRSTLFQMGAGVPQRLLIAIHHLAVDGVSWRILLEDLQTAYHQLTQGTTISFPAKTTAWQYWAQRLTAVAGALDAELDYWQAQVSQPLTLLPTDARGENTIGSGATVTVSLSATATQDLLKRVPAIYRTQINDVLIAALAQTIGEWTGESSLYLHLEGHGREELFDDVDISRTVGWFTTMFPVSLHWSEGDGEGTLLKKIKEQLRRVPNKGIGYGVLRYLQQSHSLADRPTPAISFNYLGQFDRTLSAESDFQLASESAGAESNSQGHRQHLLDISGSIVGGQLHLSWNYSSNLHQPETIERLAHRLLHHLTATIDHCLEPTAGGYTPSDFPLAQLSQPELDRIVDNDWRSVVDIYPLSPMQQGMLFHSLYAPESGVYVELVQCTLQGNLNIDVFCQAWQRVIDRYDILRTSFIWSDLTAPVQVVRQQATLPFTYSDYRDADPQQQQQHIVAAIEREKQGFEWSQPPLMRLHLMQLSAHTYEFLWSSHHILLDGWSLPLVFKEVLAAYQVYERGETIEVMPPANSYRSYIAWLQAQDMGAAKVFWQQQLEGIAAPTPLIAPTDRSALTSGSYIARLQLPPETTATLQQFVRQHQLTMSNLIQGAWALLLGRYSDERDVVFGVTVSGRPAALAGVEEIVGLFINTLPLRVAITDEIEVLPWLQTLQAQQQEIDRYAYTPLVEIQGWSEIPAGAALFESIVVFENYPLGEAVQSPPSADDLQIINVRNLQQTNFPLTLIAIPGNELAIEIRSDCSRFTTETIDRMLGHFHHLLLEITTAPNRSLDRLTLISAAERAQLTEWQQVSGYDPTELCIPALFERQVLLSPDAIAVVSGEQTITYAELNARADRLASQLQSLGVQSEGLVGICMERSIEAIVSVVAILKAGGAYVPLDPTYPPERLAYMLADTQLAVLLTQVELLDRLPPTTAQTICIDRDWEQIASHPPFNYPSPTISPTDLAYVIYTSGSTGQPKGVMIPHQGITRLVLNTNYIQFSALDRVAHAANTAFDAATFEIWGALLNGAQLTIVPQTVLLSPPDLIALLTDRQISVLFLTPALFDRLASIAPTAFGKLRYLIMGGEALDPHWVRVVQAAGAPQHLLNGYGPTESTTFATYYEVTELSPTVTNIPIGRPLAHTEISILDRYLQPVPIGVPGELHIGGAGLARGYWQRPELTAEKFIPHPCSDRPDSRLYKTGDLVRYLPSGDIEYLDRIDGQVKIRGFRIEIGEIEAVLIQHPHIRQAVVVVTTTEQGQKQLIAYGVTDPTTELSNSDVRQFLSTRLPAYMIPLVFVTLAELPLTPNGKVDKRALPTPDLTALLVTEYVAPATELEVELAEIWANLLNLKQVGTTDNFFEVGGHSLLATQFISRVHQHYQVTLPLHSFFMQPTIRDTARLILESQLSNVDDDDDFLARTLAELDDLSDEDVRQLLAQDD